MKMPLLKKRFILHPSLQASSVLLGPLDLSLVNPGNTKTRKNLPLACLAPLAVCARAKMEHNHRPVHLAPTAKAAAHSCPKAPVQVILSIRQRTPLTVHGASNVQTATCVMAKVWSISLCVRQGSSVSLLWKVRSPVKRASSARRAQRNLGPAGCPTRAQNQNSALPRRNARPDSSVTCSAPISTAYR